MSAGAPFRYALRWSLAARAWRIDAYRLLLSGHTWASKMPKSVRRELPLGDEGVAALRRARRLTRLARSAQYRADEVMDLRLDAEQREQIEGLMAWLG